MAIKQYPLPASRAGGRSADLNETGISQYAAPTVGDISETNGAVSGGGGGILTTVKQTAVSVIT